MIDDEPDVLTLCRVNLEHAGHQVLEAADGAAGLSLALEHGPDAVVLDVMLPLKGGFEVLRELLSASDDVPVVLLTARAGWDDQVRGWQEGAAAYITKPFSPATLIAEIERLLSEDVEMRRTRREDALRRLLGDPPPSRR